MSRFLDALGTVYAKFQLGLGGPQLKNNSGNVEARNAADSAYAQLSALALALFGTGGIILNAGATESGSSWKFTIQNPTSGQTQDITLILPSGAPSVGQAMTVASFTSGVATLQWSTVAAGAQLVSCDTTSLAFGSTSPVSMFTLPANAVIDRVVVVVDTAFNGTPSLSVGISGTTSKYLSSTQVDLTTAGEYEVSPGVAADASSESLIATYSAGSASAGAARILVYYSVPA